MCDEEGCIPGTEQGAGSGETLREAVEVREREAAARALREAADERAARKIAGDAADRFRDVLCEALGYDDENPGDDALVADLRKRNGHTGPEPRRWRDFLTAAVAQIDQIRADRMTP